MNRTEWLAERRRRTQDGYDTGYAPTYDLDDPPTSDTHLRFASAVIASCPPHGRVLDAACGTGKYLGLVLAEGRVATGIDQSAGMLAQAVAKYPGADLRRVALQDLDFDAEFDAALCVDAMENVPPEEWPDVLAGLCRALRPGGELYLTVEMTDEQALEDAFATATELGLPAVFGEDTRRDSGYHFYPRLDRVRAWLAGAGLDLVDAAHSPGDHPSYSYEHFRCRSAPGPAPAATGTGR
jgi:SAM-dependent methyltransferase